MDVVTLMSCMRSVGTRSRSLLAGVAGLIGKHTTPLGTIPKQWFRPFLPADPVIVEAGAHNGVDTVELSRLWPDGHVHAFEPVPDLYARLTARARKRPNITCYPLALGDRDGPAEMFVSSGTSDGSSSLLRPTGHLVHHPTVTFSRSIRVQMTTLDTWAEAHGVDHVDLMWLDMQGAEMRMLQAAPRLLATTRLVHMEVSLVELYADTPLYSEVRDWMEAHGLRVVAEALAWSDGGNVLFARYGDGLPRP